MGMEMGLVDVILFGAITYLIIRALLYRAQLKKKKEVKHLQEVLGAKEEPLCEILWSNKKYYHRLYCVDVVADGGANTSPVSSPRKLLKLGYLPCPKCCPPVE